MAHYTGKVTYDVRDMADKNRDFLPPEMVLFFHRTIDFPIRMSNHFKPINFSGGNVENIQK